MPAADEAARIALDVEALTPDARRKLMRALTPADRDKLAVLLADRRTVLAAEAQAISPWLAERIANARGAGVNDCRMTAATRRALSECAINLPARPIASAPLDSRSLLSVVGASLAGWTSR